MIKSLARFRGAGVALITPFDSEFSVDFNALKTTINFVIDEGVDYIVSLGTTGEANTLSDAEHRSILDFTIETVAGRCPIVAGIFGDNSTARLVEKVNQYNFDGIDAIMASSPAYNKPTQKGIYHHFMSMAEVSSLPIIIYNVPGRTSSNMTAETTLALARDCKKFLGVKEASGDLMQVMEIIKYRPKDFLVLSGEDQLTLPIIACGGDGAISVIANAFPKPFTRLTNAALEGDLGLAQRFNELLLGLHQWLYAEGNPTGVKAAASILGHCQNVLRPPLTALSDNALEKLQAAMDVVLQEQPFE